MNLILMLSIQELLLTLLSNIYHYLVVLCTIFIAKLCCKELHVHISKDCFLLPQKLNTMSAAICFV